MKMRTRIFCLLVLLTGLILAGNACSRNSSNDLEPSQNSAAGSGWSVWTQKTNPIFTGQYPLVGDASVIREAAGYRMSYTCFDPTRSPQGPEICAALSDDGLTWRYAPVGDPDHLGRLLPTGPGVWDTAHETSFLMKAGSIYFLYFIGYVDRGGVYNSIPSSIGFASSTDGLNFTRSSGPVLTGTPRGYDAEVISSPSVVRKADGSYLMIYAGFCGQNCDHPAGTNLLAATSRDGVSWTKTSEPFIRSSDIPWRNEGLAEAELIEGPDGFYYLFMTVLQGSNPHQLALARSQNLTGPWQVNPQPIVTANVDPNAFNAGEVVAPSVLIENNKVRLWFHGVNKNKTAIAIGYAESAWPLFQ